MATVATVAPAQPDRVLDRGRDVSLVILAGGERLALPAGEVIEVVRPRRLSRVPHAPWALLGVASLRGAVLPVVSLARLRGTEPAEPGADVAAAARLVVMAASPPFGLLVDAVATLGDASGLPRIDAASLVSSALGTGRQPSRDRSPSATAEPAAAVEPAAAASDAVRRLLAFTVAGQSFGFDLAAVVGVAHVPAAEAVPDADGALLGVAAWRGGLLPLASAAALLGRPQAGTPGRIVVVRSAGAELGLVVDEVEGILCVPAEDVEPLPALLSRGAGASARLVAICRIDAGRRLLSVLSADRLFGDDTARRALAEAPSREDAMAADTAKQAEPERFVAFDLGGEHYALPIAAVVEVVRLPEALTRVPKAPAFVEGVMRLRGAAVPVIDATRHFGAPPAPPGARRRVLVMSVDGVQTGLIVDGVSEVLTPSPGELHPAPVGVGGRTEGAADGAASLFDRVASIARDGRMVLIVDPSALLATAERDLVRSLAADGAAP